MFLCFSFLAGEMRKRKKRRKSRKWVWILFAFILLLGIIVVPRLFQSQSERQRADDYFEIFDAAVNDGDFKDGSSYEDSSILVIYGISFKLRAKGGDAHDVIIQSWAQAEPVDLETILEGQYKYVEQASVPPFGYLTEKAENGMFPFDVEIKSVEAEGTITIYPR